MILDSTSATIFGTIIRAAKASAAPPESLDAVTRQIYASEMALHDKITDQATALAESVLSIEASGEASAHVQLAIRHLEDAVYRAVKGLTA